jgi:hypothetical protein
MRSIGAALVFDTAYETFDEYRIEKVLQAERRTAETPPIMKSAEERH